MKRNLAKTIGAFVVCIILAIFASNSLTFQNRWYKDLPVIDFGERIISSPISQNGAVFVQTVKGVYSIRLEDMAILWRFPLVGEPLNCDPIIFEDMILAPDNKGAIVAISIDKGTLLWQSAQPYYSTGGSAIVEAIATRSNFIYAARYSSSLVAIDAFSGNVVWKQTVFDRSSLFLSFYDDTLYLGGDNQLVGFDPQSGEQLSSKSFPGYISAMQTDSSGIYLASRGSILLYDPVKDAIVWQKHRVADSVDYLVLMGDKLYACGDGVISMWANSGEVDWAFLDIGTSSSPAFIKNSLIVRQQKNGDYYQIDINTGVLQNRLTASSSPENVRSDRDIIAPVVISDLALLNVTSSQLIIYNLNLVITQGEH